MAKRVVFESNKRQLFNLVWELGFKGARIVSLHKKGIKKGGFFPPFLYFSFVSSCNLRCQGCWVDVTAPRKMLSLENLKKIVFKSKEIVNRFFGILDGEPFLHSQIIEFVNASYEGEALCPVVTGVSHHVNSIGNKRLKGVFVGSAFLKDFSDVVATKTNDCVFESL